MYIQLFYTYNILLLIINTISIMFINIIYFKIIFELFESTIFIIYMFETKK